MVTLVELLLSTGAASGLTAGCVTAHAKMSEIAH